MKKLLLFLMAVMAFAGMGMAQDVYSCGSYKVNDEARAAVYKNGSLLYSSTSGGSCRSMVLNPSNGDVYWVRNSSYDPNYSSILVNNNVAFLNTSIDGSIFNRLYWHDFPSHNPEDCLFAAGRVTGSDYLEYAAFWHGSDPVPFFCPGFENGHYSEGTGICVSESADGSLDIWCCGFVEGNDGIRAVVWKNNVLLYTLSNVESKALDIVYYDGDIYTVGYAIENSYYMVKVWKNGEEIISPETGGSSHSGLKVVNGDIYTTELWGVNKNGERIFSFTGGEVRSVDVNSDGVYYSRLYDGTYNIYKDDEILYTVEGCENLYEIHVAPEVCEDDGARPLPYFEGFEMGDTDWTCWTVIDEGENWTSDGYEIASYWQRLGVGSGYTPYNGEYFASHKYGLDQQEGWLISPKIQVGANATLTFQTLEQYASYMDYEGVWISTTTPEPRAFTEVWSQSNASGVWKEVTVDLSAYQGLPIYIAFKYTGDDGHDWLVDDVHVDAASTPQYYTITTGVNSVGAGTVSGGGTYPAGATVTLTATPNTGYSFIGWDDSNTENPRTITVTGDDVYIANFAPMAPTYYTITVESANPVMGTVNGDGTYPAGATVTLTATPFAGYYFVGWDDGNADNPRQITVTQNATYIAQFASNPVVTFTLNVLCNTDQGTTVGSGTYTAGATVNIAAVPNASFEFDKWNDNNRENPRQVTVNSNLTFVAFFKNVGVDENDGCLMAIYPNPASDFIRIEGIGDDSEVRIYNAMGALVKVTTASANEEIGIGEFSEGLYLLRCGNISLRFVKE